MEIQKISCQFPMKDQQKQNINLADEGNVQPKTQRSLHHISTSQIKSRCHIPVPGQYVISYNFQNDKNSKFRTHNLLVGLDQIVEGPSNSKSNSNKLHRLNYTLNTKKDNSCSSLNKNKILTKQNGNILSKNQTVNSFYHNNNYRTTADQRPSFEDSHIASQEDFHLNSHNQNIAQNMNKIGSRVTHSIPKKGRNVYQIQKNQIQHQGLPNQEQCQDKHQYKGSGMQINGGKQLGLMSKQGLINSTAKKSVSRSFDHKDKNQFNSQESKNHIGQTSFAQLKQDGDDMRTVKKSNSKYTGQHSPQNKLIQDRNYYKNRKNSAQFLSQYRNNQTNQLHNQNNSKGLNKLQKGIKNRENLTQFQRNQRKSQASLSSYKNSETYTGKNLIPSKSSKIKYSSQPQSRQQYKQESSSNTFKRNLHPLIKAKAPSSFLLDEFHRIQSETEQNFTNTQKSINTNKRMNEQSHKKKIQFNSNFQNKEENESSFVDRLNQCSNGQDKEQNYFRLNNLKQNQLKNEGVSRRKDEQHVSRKISNSPSIHNNNHFNNVSERSNVTKRHKSNYRQMVRLLSEENEKKNRQQEQQKLKEGLNMKSSRFQTIQQQNQHVRRITNPIQRSFLEQRRRKITLQKQQKSKRSKSKEQSLYQDNENINENKNKNGDRPNRVSNSGRKQHSKSHSQNIRNNSQSINNGEGFKLKQKVNISGNKNKLENNKSAGNLSQAKFNSFDRKKDSSTGKQNNRKKKTQTQHSKNKNGQNNATNQKSQKVSGIKIPQKAIQNSSSQMFRKHANNSSLNKKKSKQDTEKPHEKNSIINGKHHKIQPNSKPVDKRTALQKQRKFKDWKNGVKQEKEKKEHSKRAALDKNIYKKDWKQSQKVKATPKNKNRSKQIDDKRETSKKPEQSESVAMVGMKGSQLQEQNIKQKQIMSEEKLIEEKSLQQLSYKPNLQFNQKNDNQEQSKAVAANKSIIPLQQTLQPQIQKKSNITPQIENNDKSQVKSPAHLTHKTAQKSNIQEDQQPLKTKQQLQAQEAKRQKVMQNLLQNQQLKQDGIMEITQSKMHIYNPSHKELPEQETKIQKKSTHSNQECPTRAQITSRLYDLPQKYEQQISKFSNIDLSKRFKFHSNRNQTDFKKVIQSKKLQKSIQIIHSSALLLDGKNYKENFKNTNILKVDFLKMIIQPYFNTDNKIGIWLYSVGVWRLTCMEPNNTDNFWTLLEKGIKIVCDKYYNKTQIQDLTYEEILRMITGLRIIKITKNKGKNKSTVRMFKQIEYNLRKNHIVQGFLTGGKQQNRLNSDTVNYVKKVECTPTGQKVVQIISYQSMQYQGSAIKPKYYWIKQDKFLSMFDCFTVIGRRAKDSYWTNQTIQIENSSKAVYLIDSANKPISGSISIYPSQNYNLEQEQSTKCTIAFYKEVQPQVMKLIGKVSEKLSIERSLSKLYFDFNIKGNYYVFLDLHNGNYDIAIESNTNDLKLEFLEFIKKETNKNQQCQYVEIDKVFKAKTQGTHDNDLASIGDLKKIMNFMKKSKGFQ